MSIGLPSDAPAGRNSRELVPGRLAGSSATSTPAGLAGVGAHDPRAAGVGDDRDPVAARDRLRRAAARRRRTARAACRCGSRRPARTARRRSHRRPTAARRCATRSRGAPAAERPLLTASIGLRAPTPGGRSRANFRGFPNDSRYSKRDVGAAGPAPSTGGSRCPTGRPCCRPRRTTTARLRAGSPPR